MTIVSQITTVHSRRDVRIWLKECHALVNCQRQLYLIVADSLGDEEVDGIRVVDLGTPRGGRPGRFLIGSWRVFRQIRRQHPDLLHFHDPELIPVCLLLRLLGHRVVYDVHEDMPKQILAKYWLPAGIRRVVAFAVAGVERLAALFFDGFVAATPLIANRFPAAKTVLVRNFPVVDEFQDITTVDQAAREPAFGYIGVIASIRGAVQMIDAVGELSADLDVRLKLAGNVSPLELQRNLQRLPGWQRVDLLGWLSRKEIVQLLGRVRCGLVILQPTLNYVESLPVKLFEYMAAGLPVIASDFPPWRDIVEQADCGLLVDPTDVSSISEAMLWMLENPTLADAMGRRGREAVAVTYNWSLEAQKLNRFYEVLGV